MPSTNKNNDLIDTGKFRTLDANAAAVEMYRAMYSIWAALREHEAREEKEIVDLTKTVELQGTEFAEWRRILKAMDEQEERRKVCEGWLKRAVLMFFKGIGWIK